MSKAHAENVSKQQKECDEQSQKLKIIFEYLENSFIGLRALPSSTTIYGDIPSTKRKYITMQFEIKKTASDMKERKSYFCNN